MKYRITRWLGIVFITLLVAACGNDSPSGVVRSFYKNIEKGEITKAMDALPERALIMGESKVRMGLEIQTERMSQMGGIKEIEAKDDCRGEVCHVETKITFGNGHVESDDIKMVKEKGKWKINFG